MALPAGGAVLAKVRPFLKGPQLQTWVQCSCLCPHKFSPRHTPFQTRTFARLEMGFWAPVSSRVGPAHSQRCVWGDPGTPGTAMSGSSLVGAAEMSGWDVGRLPCSLVSLFSVSAPAPQS